MRLRASGKGMRITCAEAKQREDDDDDDDSKSSEFKGTRASARPLGVRWTETWAEERARVR